MSFPHTLWLNNKYYLTGMNHGVEWDVPWVYQKITLRNLKERFSFFLLRSVTKFSSRKLKRIITNDLFFIHFTTLKKPHLQHKFHYIPNFVDLNKFNPNVKPDQEIKSKFSSKKIILLPKMAMKERGTDIMIDIMKNLKNDNYQLIITGTSSGIKYWENLVIENNLQNCVYFTGHIDTKRIPNIYASADIVVLPSPCREATAIAMLETMAMQKPLVLSNIGGLPEVGRDRFNCLLRNANEQEFMEAIIELNNNKSLANEISKNGHDYVKKAFNTEIWDRSMIKFFTK